MSSDKVRFLSRNAFAAALLLCAACSVAAQDVRYNALPDTDFTKYKTYRWVRIEGAQYPNEIVDTQIKGSIDSQLSAKGLTKTDDERADLYLGYQVAISEDQQWHTYGAGMGWGPYPAMGYGGGMTTATSSTIHTGTLALDIYDTAAKKLVWRGSASKTLDENAKPEKRQKNLDKAVAKLLKKYPPPAPKE